ncbi:hypothetical protein SCUCBS95973_008738 [Sporothrix curviconia]|uniref:Glycoside hydrolase family 125 protein n=1 Tax=Sporothrix curviconia TaxID=1260050 RepID=A0ABP0CP38_9PEZI
MVHLGAILGAAFAATSAVSARPSPENSLGSTKKRAAAAAAGGGPDCPDYASHATSHAHEPFSSGRYRLPYQRPSASCRRFQAPEVEATIEAMRKLVRDPDLFRLFENCFPNTLDTAIAWHGLGEGTADEELTFVTTGDINAMWLRDSANQLQSYRSLLRPVSGKDKASPSSSLSSLASLFRGTINLQARYIQNSPHCNAFRPPAESGLTVTGGFGGGDIVYPPVAHEVVFECKYELDSLAAFLQLSYDYYAATQDGAFFGKRFKKEEESVGDDDVEFRSNWVLAVEAILATAEEMTRGTYGPDGRTLFSPYQFQRPTTVATETLPNGGAGSPVQAGTGMVRSAFRPSDDACTYQLFVPANMMLARYLAACAPIVAQLGRRHGAAGDIPTTASETRLSNGDAAHTSVNINVNDLFDDDDYSNYRQGHRTRYYHELALRMTDFAETVRRGIERHGRVHHEVYGNIYAYEVDGFGSHNLMDDANIPSLLSAPLLGYVDRHDPVYRNTRRFVLSHANPYYMTGPVINGTGGPHVGTGMAWPMSLVVQIMTTDSDREIVALLQQLLSSTDGLGLMHESISSHDEGVWTRQWFSWANGLFGQMLLDLRDRKPHLLAKSFQ